MDLPDKGICKKLTASATIIFRLLSYLIIIKLQTHPSFYFILCFGSWHSAVHISALPASFLLGFREHETEAAKLEEEEGTSLFSSHLFVLMHPEFFILEVTVVSKSSSCFQFAAFSYFRICLTMPRQR